MFNGIVEATGHVVEIEVVAGCKSFTIAPYFDGLQLGESIAVNGVCLTVTAITNETFSVTAVPETLRLTNLDYLTTQHNVNLERAMRIEQRLSGHYVQGHVDGVGQLLSLEADQSAALLAKISLPKALSRYVVAKGFIAIDGMSITIIDVAPEWFTVTFIPHTQAVTIIPHYQVGHWLNLEVDMIAKHLEKLLGAYSHVIAH